MVTRLGARQILVQLTDGNLIDGLEGSLHTGNASHVILLLLKYSKWDMARIAQALEINEEDLIAAYNAKGPLPPQKLILLMEYIEVLFMY